MDLETKIGIGIIGVGALAGFLAPEIASYYVANGISEYMNFGTMSDIALKGVAMTTALPYALSGSRIGSYTGLVIGSEVYYHATNGTKK